MCAGAIGGACRESLTLTVDHTFATANRKGRHPPCTLDTPFLLSTISSYTTMRDTTMAQRLATLHGGDLNISVFNTASLAPFIFSRRASQSTLVHPVYSVETCESPFFYPVCGTSNAAYGEHCIATRPSYRDRQAGCCIQSLRPPCSESSRVEARLDSVRLEALSKKMRYLKYAMGGALSQQISATTARIVPTAHPSSVQRRGLLLSTNQTINLLPKLAVRGVQRGASSIWTPTRTADLIASRIPSGMGNQPRWHSNT